MLLRKEVQLLYTLGKDYFGNWGHIIDAGCFLGGSTVALAQGVLNNPTYQRNPRHGVIHSYDQFAVESYTVPRFFPEGTPLGSSFEATYRKNIADVADLVDVCAGDICQYGRFDEPIEILFIDVAKHWVLNDFVVWAFFPALVPQQSVVIQQDYLYEHWNGWLLVTMEYFADYFEILDHTDRNSVVFGYTRRIPDSMLKRNVVQSMSLKEITDLCDRAIGRFSGEQKQIMTKSREHLIGLLQSVAWPPDTGSSIAGTLT